MTDAKEVVENEDAMSEPKILNPPDEIWLVYGDLDEDVEHGLCGEVSWCEEPQFPADVRYVRADTITTLQSRIEALQARLMEADSVMEKMVAHAEALEKAGRRVAAPESDEDWDWINNHARTTMRHHAGRCGNQTMTRADNAESHIVWATIAWIERSLLVPSTTPPAPQEAP
jgi:hypothetical protein